MKDLLPSSSFLCFLRGGNLLAVAMLSFCLPIEVGKAIPLTGANGRTVEFVGIKSAGPKGLTVQVEAGGQTFELGWEKLDLKKLETQHPGLNAAYKKALVGESTQLNLGSFAPKTAAKKMDPEPVRPTKPEGYFEVKVSPLPDEQCTNAVIGISIPKSEPKAILLLSEGRNLASLAYHSRERGDGPWGDFQTELGFAILTYAFVGEPAEAEGGLRKAPDFVQAQNGSGAALLRGLAALAEESGAKLTELPFAIYGIEALGAAFAFNFTQWKPERVIATVAAKGAFYATPPTPESVKVPLLIFWGEYSRGIPGFQPSHTHAEIYGDHVNLKPNWMYAMEFRGPNNETQVSFDFGKNFLKKMIELRMTDDGLADLDRAGAWVGDLKKFQISRMEDPETVLTSEQTWLPDEEWAKKWKDLADGKYLPESSETDP